MPRARRGRPRRAPTIRPPRRRAGPPTRRSRSSCSSSPGPNIARRRATRSSSSCRPPPDADPPGLPDPRSSGTALLVPSAALEAHAEGKFFELMDELNAEQRDARSRSEELLELGAQGRHRSAARRRWRPQSEPATATCSTRTERRFERLHAGNTPERRCSTARPPQDAARRARRRRPRARVRGAPTIARSTCSIAASPPASSPRRSTTRRRRGPQPIVATAVGARRRRPIGPPFDPPLATPPLELDGLPSFGSPAATPPCRSSCCAGPSDTSVRNAAARGRARDAGSTPTTSASCGRRGSTSAATTPPSSRMLGDAALCAEQIGSNQGRARATSPAGAGSSEMYAQSGREPRQRQVSRRAADRRTSPTKLDVDRRALAACRARIAGTTLELDRGGPALRRAARRPGDRDRRPDLRRADHDQTLLQALVEAELAPGVLGSHRAGTQASSWLDRQTARVTRRRWS